MTLELNTALTPSNKRLQSAINKTLHFINDSAENDTHSTRLVAWSPLEGSPQNAIILTSANSTCASPTSPAFKPLAPHLASPPSCRHIYLDYSILSLAASSPDTRIPCDIILLHAPNSGIAGVIGKTFGWDPKRSSLAAQMESGGPFFAKPGDMVRDFFCWAELENHPLSPSSSHSLNSDGELCTTNGDFLRGEWIDPGNEPGIDRAEEETLVMMFQWWSREDGERFKHPLQRSQGPGGSKVAPDMWERQIAHPVRQLEGIGARVESLKVNLRGIGPREEEEEKATRERSGSRRLSALAVGMGEKISFWK